MKVVVFFYLYYDLGAKVKPRDDTTVLKLCGAGKGEINTACLGGGVLCFMVLTYLLQILYNAVD